MVVCIYIRVYIVSRTTSLRTTTRQSTAVPGSTTAVVVVPVVQYHRRRGIYIYCFILRSIVLFKK